MHKNARISDREIVAAYMSRLGQDEEIEAYGVSRATGVTPLSAALELDRLTAQNILYKTGSWYGVKR